MRRSTRQQRRWGAGVAIAVALLALTACSTKVERIGMDEQRDLSGKWNDTDSRIVSETMIEAMLSSRWLENYERDHDQPPTVVVGDVRNLSHEHINVNTFISDVEAAVINSGRVSFIAGGDVREAIRDERAQQDLHASAETRKEMGQEVGADYMLTGTINSIVDTEGNEEVIYYQVNLALTSIADNRRVWVGQEEIRKFVERARFRS